MTSKSAAQILFDELIMSFDDCITVDTATRLAKELGLDFVPDNY